MVAAAALLSVGKQNLHRAASAAAFVFIAISYVIVVAPTLLILGAPLLAISGLTALVVAKNEDNFYLRFAMVVAIPVLCVIFGYPFFLYGLLANSAAPFFQNLSIRPGALAEASLLFWSPVKPIFFTVERTFILMGLIGGIWAVARARGTLRSAAITFVATAFLYTAVGVVHTYRPFWYGPAPWYFEGFLFPLFGVFAVTLLCEVGNSAVRLVIARDALLRSSRSPWLSAVLTITIAVVPWLLVKKLQTHAGPPNLPYYEPYPQPETPITRILKDEIALKPGATFRGREATLTGLIFPLTSNIDFVGLSGIPDVLAMQATGNLHNFAGLWQDAIPTLLEYNPLLTAAYFAFVRTFFTEPADRQIRNVLAMRRIDTRMLAAVGVRFFITDAPFEGNARLRQTIPVPVMQETLSRLGIRAHIESFTLYLYEIENANLGQYSPIEIRHAATASEMLQILADPAFDLTKTAVTADEVIPQLVPATLREFVVERGYFRLKATSDGWSVLVLPMEYSHCLRLDPDAIAAGARLFRADLLMTGVLLNKSVNTRLTYRTGPLTGSGCRLDDASDMKKIRIEDSFRTRPDLAPIPIESD